MMLLLHHGPQHLSGSGDVLQPGSSWHLPWHQLVVQAQHFLSLFFHSKLHHYCGMEKADILCGVWGWKQRILAPLKRDRELHGSELSSHHAIFEMVPARGSFHGRRKGHTHGQHRESPCRTQ